MTDPTATKVAELLYDLFAVGAVIPDGLRLVAQERGVPVDDVVALQEAAFALAIAPEPEEDEEDDEDTGDPDSTATVSGRWTCWDIAGLRVSYDHISAEEAAYAYVFDGDYVHPTLGEWTSFIEVSVAETEDGPDARGVTIHVPLYPGAPPCSDDPNVVDPNEYGIDDDGHLWIRFSTTGDGAGVYITEECAWCGILKDTRTRPTCHDCGETLSMEAIRYRREEE
jgi:hypothetical protein